MPCHGPHDDSAFLPRNLRTRALRVAATRWAAPPALVAARICREQLRAKRKATPRKSWRGSPSPDGVGGCPSKQSSPSRAARAVPVQTTNPGPPGPSVPPPDRMMSPGPAGGRHRPLLSPYPPPPIPGREKEARRAGRGQPRRYRTPPPRRESSPRGLELELEGTLGS